MSKKIITPESLYDLKNVTDVQLAPDGSQVVYVVEAKNKKEDKSETTIWLQKLGNAEEPRRLTSHTSDASPRWSADGKSIAFISARSEKPKLYVIPVDGGEAKEITTSEPPISPPLWSPDGKHLAFKAVVERDLTERYPNEPKELLVKPEKEEDKKNAPRVITDINYQADGRGLIFDKFAHIFVVNLADNKCEQLTEGNRRIEDMTWDGKGSALYYVTDNYCPTYARHTSSVYQVDIATKATSHLLNFAGGLRAIDLAAKGRHLLLTGPDNSLPTGVGAARLWLADLHAPTLPLRHEDLRCLTPDLDANCFLARWAEEDEALYFVRFWHGAARLTKLSLSDYEPGEISDPDTGDLRMISQFAVGAGQLVFVGNNFVTPPELFQLKADKVVPLTHLHDDFLKAHHVSPAESFNYKGADGWDVAGWLVRPLDYEEGRRYPTVLSVHGGPTGIYMDAWDPSFQMLAQQGFAVVFTNPRGSIGYGEDFTYGCVHDLGGKDFEDIMLGLDEAIKMGVVDPSRVGITGWSYGGYMSCWSITQTDRFRAAVAGAPISNWIDLYGCGDSHVYDEGLFGGPPYIKEEEHLSRSPLRFVQNVKTPLLLLHGELDVRCPTGQSDQFFTALKRAGKDVVYVRYPGQFHGLRRPSYQVDRWLRTGAWFKHYLLGATEDK